MPRTVDLQLLVVALAAGGVVAGLATRRPGGRVGVAAVLAGLALAWVADRRLVHALPREVVDGYEPWVVVAATAAIVGWGATRLPTAPTLRVPPVLPLALASLAGVWVGVPETSAAILVAGVLLGVAIVLVVSRGTVTAGAAVAIAVAPLAAAGIGAAGDDHALVGGLLCSATFAALALGGRIRVVPAATLVRATALHLVAALVAARHVGVSRDWDGSVAVSVLVVGLAVVAAAVLHRGQPGPPA